MGREGDKPRNTPTPHCSSHLYPSLPHRTSDCYTAGVSSSRQEWQRKQSKAGTHFVQPWLAAHAWNALSTTSTMRCEVSTFPPHTAAVRDGLNSDFFGILTANPNSSRQQQLNSINANGGQGKGDAPSRGTRQPALSGISMSSIERMQYITAECTTEMGALRLPRTSAPVPAKSSTADPSCGLISTRSWIYHAYTYTYMPT